MANFAPADLDSLVHIVKRKLKKIQYRPHLTDGCLAAGLAIEPLVTTCSTCSTWLAPTGADYQASPGSRLNFARIAEYGRLAIALAARTAALRSANSGRPGRDCIASFLDHGRLRLSSASGRSERPAGCEQC
jgi:hypothetical protein